MRISSLHALMVMSVIGTVACSGQDAGLPQGSGGDTLGTGGRSSPSGGSAQGGSTTANTTGGTTTGGGASGGRATGGAASGGASTGGSVSSGGTPGTGGKSTGGAASGGATAGGAATGGMSAIGGSSTTGGNSSTGGAATGGAGTGGSTNPTGPRTACTAPAGYRNLFTEVLGKTQADVDTKMTTVIQQLFHGSTSNQAIYFEYGTDQAYIEDIANNDVRSEGMSYGMTIAVQMGMKTEFDKLWTYASKCMRQSNGLFAWQMNPNSCTPKSTGAAPDGEEYFAMALMLASRRWGDTGTYNYGSEAKKVMAAMLAARPAGEFNSNPNVVSFGPYQDFSDPSYILPLFYSEWACFDTAHTAFWNQATTDGRAFFKKTCNASTGLAPYEANWDGSPRAGNGTFNADAWRVPMDIMMDYNLNNADSWQSNTYAKTMAAFWVKEGLSSYGSGYNLDGSGKSGMHGVGLTGVNAMLAFALPATDGKPFLQAAWDAAAPTGTYRYYDGCLYMLSMLHLSGKFSLFYD